MDATTTPVPVKRSGPVAGRPAMSMFGALHREIDRLFDDFTRGGLPSFASAGATVRMDLADTKAGIELTAELPGLEEKDVQVTLTDNVLTVSGEKQAEKEEKEKNYHFIERSYGAFSRSIELPADIQADKITATMTSGVLKVVVPRAAKAEPKKIEVKPAA